MDRQLPPINLIPCVVRQVRWRLAALACDRCHQSAGRVWDATRTAIDLDLDQPVLLAVTVSVDHCRSCRHSFRAQPPFLRPDAVYTNRVVTKAVQAVYHDGMAIRRVAVRLARDFWVTPSSSPTRASRPASMSTSPAIRRSVVPAMSRPQAAPRPRPTMSRRVVGTMSSWWVITAPCLSWPPAGRLVRSAGWRSGRGGQRRRRGNRRSGARQIEAGFLVRAHEPGRQRHRLGLGQQPIRNFSG